MAKTAHYYTKFEPGCFYHIYNRTVNKQPMFRNAKNYEYFLKKYDEYLTPVLDTFAYNLLGNHFHLMVRVREDLTAFIGGDLTTFEKLSNQKLSNLKLSNQKTTHEIVSHQFRKFFQCYAMSFNKQYARTGTLFQTPFKRAMIDGDNYFTRIIYYIHANAQHHGIVKDFKDWPWSSYGSILSEKTSKLKKQDVINWFGTKEQYKDYHAAQSQILAKDEFIFEDEYE